MHSQTDLRRLIADISDNTSRASASSQERISSSRQLIASDTELKAMSEQALKASAETLARLRD